MSVIAPSAMSSVPTTERTTSGVIRDRNPVPRLEPPRRVPRDVVRARVGRGLVVVVRAGLRVAIGRQTSTTTGKTIGRRFVCSYR